MEEKDEPLFNSYITAGPGNIKRKSFHESSVLQWQVIWFLLQVNIIGNFLMFFEHNSQAFVSLISSHQDVAKNYLILGSVQTLKSCFYKREKDVNLFSRPFILSVYFS